MALRVPPLAQVFVLGVAMFSLRIAFPRCTFEFQDSAWAAIAFGVFGASLLAISLFQCWLIRTSIDPRLRNQPVSLVTSGVYRLTRNPMYLGFFCVLAAWASFLSHYLAVALLPIFVWYMNRFQILPEESYLEAHFGEEYCDYKSRVRRWI